MNCKFCNAELDPGISVCPACGRDNAEAVQEAPKRKMKTWQIAVAVVCVVALLAGLVAAGIGIMNGSMTLQAEEITAKGSYSVTGEEAAASADVVVAKAGDFELTNGELQVIYWSMVYDFIDYYGDYAYYFIDFSTGLDEQYYNEDDGVTWQMYFLDMALQSWRRYEVLTEKAKLAGVEMEADLQDWLDNLYDTMKESLDSYGFDSVEDMLLNDFGAGADYDDYLAYMEIYYHGNQYFNQLYTELEFTDAEIEAYYTENETDLVSAGYGKDAGNMVSVRHILIQPSDDTTATDYTDAEWAACYTEAERVLNEWLAGEATDATFAEFANTYSADSDGTDGGLYTGITSSTSFVEPFLNWCMDESRQVGDYGIVQTTYGYHIMYFVESAQLWYEASSYYLLSDTVYEMLTGWEAEYPMTVGYSRIELGEVSFY